MAIAPERFARTLLALRERRALERDEAADLIGVSLRQYKRWEAATSTPGLSRARDVAAAYNLPIEDLMDDILADPDEPPQAVYTDLLHRVTHLEKQVAEVLDLLRPHHNAA